MLLFRNNDDIHWKELFMDGTSEYVYEDIKLPHPVILSGSHVLSSLYSCIDIRNYNAVGVYPYDTNILYITDFERLCKYDINKRKIILRESDSDKTTRKYKMPYGVYAVETINKSVEVWSGGLGCAALFTSDLKFEKYKRRNFDNYWIGKNYVIKPNDTNAGTTLVSEDKKEIVYEEPYFLKTRNKIGLIGTNVLKIVDETFDYHYEYIIGEMKLFDYHFVWIDNDEDEIFDRRCENVDIYTLDLKVRMPMFIHEFII